MPRWKRPCHRLTAICHPSQLPPQIHLPSRELMKLNANSACVYLSAMVKPRPLFRVGAHFLVAWCYNHTHLTTSFYGICSSVLCWTKWSSSTPSWSKKWSKNFYLHTVTLRVGSNANMVYFKLDSVESLGVSWELSKTGSSLKRNEGSRSNKMHSCLPQILLRKYGKFWLAVPPYSTGLGSKSSTAFINHFFAFPHMFLILCFGYRKTALFSSSTDRNKKPREGFLSEV